jgi:uncharacterized phage protein gp47/JayE
MNGPCGCCQPSAPLTPLAVYNRPGLSAVAYRIGTYASFRESMLEAISRTPELAGLGTRRDDDYAITFLNLFAAAADVTTFYRERYFNEVLVRTATQDESLRRLAQLLGYDPRPGVAALAELAFTADFNKVVQVPVGLRIQSVPAQNQQPQTFETLEAGTVDWRFNNLRVFPKPLPQNPLRQHSVEATLARDVGSQQAASFAANDPVLIFNNLSFDSVEEKRVKQTRAEDDRIILRWTQPVQAATWNTSSKVSKFKRRLQFFGYNVQPPWFHAETSSTVPGGIAWILDSTFVSPISGNVHYLDARYSDLAAGTPLLFLIPSGGGMQTILRKVVSVDQEPQSYGPLNDTVTRISLDGALPSFDRTKAGIYELTGDELSFWDAEYDSKIKNGTLYLPGILLKDNRGIGVEVGRTVQQNASMPGFVIHPEDLDSGRKLLLTDANNHPIKAILQSPPTIDPPSASSGSFVHLVLTVAADSVSLQTPTARLLGNVLTASHGETVNNEIIGSGDASQKFQHFSLQKQPLTYVPGSGPNGVVSSLSVRVNGLLWEEVPGLYEQPAGAHVFSTASTEDMRRVVQLGDGNVGGSVAPTGQANISATYRVGSGLVGRVSENALTTLLDSLQGLTGVTNPMAAEGGADPETLEAIRQNAPTTVRTFGRAVSLQDLVDLMMASGEVAKAEAIWVWDGLAPAVYLTVAGQAGGTFSEPQDLVAALKNACDPNHRLLVGNYQSVPILLSATVLVDPEYVQAEVVNAANAAVLDALAFDNLKLGKSLHLSGMFSALQNVPGVTAVDIDLFAFRQPDGMSASDFNAYQDSRGVERMPDGSVALTQGHLRVFSARPDSTTPGRVFPAELATVQVPGQDISITARGN